MLLCADRTMQPCDRRGETRLGPAPGPHQGHEEYGSRFQAPDAHIDLEEDPARLRRQPGLEPSKLRPRLHPPAQVCPPEGMASSKLSLPRIDRSMPTSSPVPLDNRPTLRASVQQIPSAKSLWKLNLFLWELVQIELNSPYSFTAVQTLSASMAIGRLNSPRQSRSTFPFSLSCHTRRRCYTDKEQSHEIDRSGDDFLPSSFRHMCLERFGANA